MNSLNLSGIFILLVSIFAHCKQSANYTKKEMKMEWISLTDESQISEIVEKSRSKPQVIFKHSIRCSISSVVKNRLDKSTQVVDMDFYFLDLIRNRNMSNKISEVFQVEHESPQVLVIRDGKSVYDESHMNISMDAVISGAGKN